MTKHMAPPRERWRSAIALLRRSIRLHGAPRAAVRRGLVVVASMAASIAAGMACAAPTSLASAEALHVRALAATCAACHGTDGKPPAGSAFARLAGMDAAVTTARLQAFRDGTQPATVMQQLAKGYSDGQIQALAAYFAAQR